MTAELPMSSANFLSSCSQSSGSSSWPGCSTCCSGARNSVGCRRSGRSRRHLQVGDDVLTTSGIFGTIIELGDDDLRLEIAPGTVVRVAAARSASGSPPTRKPTPPTPTRLSKQ